MEGWNGSEKKEGTLIRERDSFIERFFSFNKISGLLRMRRLFEKKETFLEVAHINYPRHFLITFWAETFFLRLQIQFFLRVPTFILSFLKNQKERHLMLWLLLASTFSELACLWFATWGILLSKEGFISLDLVHQRKRTIMPFVRLENVTSINDSFNFH